MPPKKSDVADVEEVMPERIRVKAISPIRHNGKTYGPGLPDGADLDVSPAEHDELHALGVLAAEELS